MKHYTSLGTKQEVPLAKPERNSTNAEPVRKSALSFMATIGPTQFSCAQTGIDDISEIAATGKFAMDYSPGKRWSLGGNFFGNIAPVTSNRPGVTIQVLGGNLRLGYSMPFIPAPWRLDLMVGGYYSQMFVTGDQFGYRSLFNPELYPVVSRRFGNGQALSFYGKYVPINSTTSFEAAAGMSWRKMAQNSPYGLVVAFDYALLKYLFSENSTFALRSASLSAGMAF